MQQEEAITITGLIAIIIGFAFCLIKQIAWFGGLLIIAGLIVFVVGFVSILRRKK